MVTLPAVAGPAGMLVRVGVEDILAAKHQRQAGVERVGRLKVE